MDTGNRASETGDPAASVIRVLHVEDDEAFADLTATYLERDDGGAPLSVRTVTDPQAALGLVADVDCVVSDYEMHSMDGLELLEAVREDHPELPFVLFTGRGNEGIASDAISAGVTDYIQKDTGTDQYAVLANTVRNAVSRRRAHEAAERGEQRLRRALDLLPQCVLVKTLDGEYLLVNESGAENYGMTPEEVEGRMESELVPDDLVERFRREDEQVIESGEPLYVPEQHVDDEHGGERVEEVHKIPFDAPGTDEPAVLTVVADVTESYERRHRLAGAATRIGDALAELNADDTDVDRLESILEDARAYAVGDCESLGDAE
ncbi:PAS domain-containing protein [Halobacterium jilantaiense]|uniref:PAS domain S-box-containing protein n=1 Tax=Halobacterium jilantaiense TaxID=355548 RepID=A0A1I0QDI1_9EURY|nr:PAS domain-containing protein [Halobacterium jilantaiense]SEW25016.1 PAS domain S-box-containing protein [Halobacterium jilantaiense]